MYTVGITGHQAIPDEARDHIVSVLTEVAEAHRGGEVVSSLAAGADQLFVTIALAHDFALRVLIPSADYESTFDAAGRAGFEELLGRARSVIRLAYAEPSEEAFMAGGVAVVDRCDLLIAVWDGEPSRGLGGTADVVEYARDQGREVRIIWLDGVRRG